MRRGLFIPNRKVEARETAVQSTRSLIVSACGFFLCDESSEPRFFTVYPNDRSPFVVVRRNTFVPRRDTMTLFAVAVIFCRRRFSQIVASVIETISVLVINPLVALRLHEIAMKKNRFPANNVLASVAVTPNRPVPPRHVREICLINLRKFPTSERKKSNARLRSRGNRNSLARRRGSGAYGAKLIGTFAATRSLCGVTVRRFVQNTANDAQFFIQPRCHAEG